MDGNTALVMLSSVEDSRLKQRKRQKIKAAVKGSIMALLKENGLPNFGDDGRFALNDACMVMHKIHLL